MEQGGGDIPFDRQQLGRAIERIPFADAAEIDLQSLAEIANGTTVAIECQEPSASAAHGLGPLSRYRHTALALEEAPGLDEGPGRDVECALRMPGDVSGELDQIKQSAFDFDIAIRCRGVESAYFRVVAIDGQLVFEFVDAIETGLGGGVSIGGTEWEQDFEERSHCPPGGAEDSDINDRRNLFVTQQGGEGGADEVGEGHEVNCKGTGPPKITDDSRASASGPGAVP